METLEKWWNEYDETLKRLEAVLRDYESGMNPPALVELNNVEVLRFPTQDINHAILLKLAMVLSGANAALILLRHGHVLEQGALQRMIDEANEDIRFLVLAVTNGSVTPLHERFLTAFWAEEFGDLSDVSGSHQSREQIPRKKIRAYVSSFHPTNPSTLNHISTVVAKAYSGFVHGAAPHLMEIYDPAKRVFRVRGMLGTSRVISSTFDFFNFVYRVTVSFAFAARAYDASAHAAQLERELQWLDSLREQQDKARREMRLRGDL